MKTIGLGYDLAPLHIAAVVGADMIECCSHNVLR